MNPTSPAGVILYGVVSGVVTSAVLFVGIQAFRMTFLPWYHNFVYRGIRLDGKWKVTDLSGSPGQTTELQLTQQADHVTGTCTFVKLDETGDEFYEKVRTCKLSGTIRDRFVELSFRHVDPARLGAGVFLLEVTRDGRMMEGQQTFYSVGGSHIVSSPVLVHRPDTLPPRDPSQLPLLEPTAEETTDRPSRPSRPAKRQGKRH